MNLWKTFKVPVLISLGVAGIVLLLNSVTAILPEWLTTLYQFILGIILIIVAVYYMRKK